MVKRDRKIEDDDLKVLKRFSVLRVDRHPEKAVKFKTTTNDLYQQLSKAHEDTFRAMETRLDSPWDMIKCLKTVLDSCTRDLSQYMAAAEALNDEAIEMARFAIALAPIRPERGPKRPQLSLIKS